jgi:hypothetical protein
MELAQALVILMTAFKNRSKRTEMAKYRYKEMSEATNCNLLKGSGYR